MTGAAGPLTASYAVARDGPILPGRPDGYYVSRRSASRDRIAPAVAEAGDPGRAGRAGTVSIPGFYARLSATSPHRLRSSKQVRMTINPGQTPRSPLTFCCPLRDARFRTSRSTHLLHHQRTALRLKDSPPQCPHVLRQKSNTSASRWCCEP